MARVLGETARYVTNQAAKKSLQITLLLYLFGITIGFFSGYLVGVNHIYIILLSLPIFLIIWKYFAKKLKALEKERECYRKGAIGEAVIGYVLESFPNDYRIIHDLTTPFGNIDHLVVGPNGAYVIDAKNWKGVVTPDGKGELLLNGKPTQKPDVKNLVRTIMDVKDRVKVLSGLDPYVKGILAFPSAHVEARWGTTGAVHCVADEKLYEYIVENKNGSKLNKKEIESISQAFLAIARMDKDFNSEEK
jgi:hypothetical protein